jgi:hypothetical protein
MSAQIPMPVSRTEIMTSPASRETVSQICPPGSVYLPALLRRFATTCESRNGSASTVSRSPENGHSPNNLLTLAQAGDAGALVGRVSWQADDKWTFRVIGTGPEDQGLVFTHRESGLFRN